MCVSLHSSKMSVLQFGFHVTQRAFLSAVMKALASISKQMCEAATVCGVDMFKACAYVGDSSAPVFRYYLNLIQGNLQVSLQV